MTTLRRRVSYRVLRWAYMLCAIWGVLWWVAWFGAAAAGEATIGNTIFIAILVVTLFTAAALLNRAAKRAARPTVTRRAAR